MPNMKRGQLETSDANRLQRELAAWRARAERQQETLERLERLCDLTADAAYEFAVRGDGTLQLAWMNDVMRTLTEPAAIGVSAHGWEALMHPDDAPRYHAHLDALRQGARHDCTFRISDGEGRTRWLRDRARGYADASGRIAVISGLTEDVTEQRVSEEAVRDSERRWHALVDRHPDPILLLSGGRMTYANEAAARLLGAQRRPELTGRPLADFATPRLRDALNAQLCRGETDGAAIRFEFTLHHDGSSPRTVECMAVPTAYRDARAVQVVLRDVTARRAHEAELLAARHEAERLARTRATILANLSHEIRTPLTSILGFASLILDQGGTDVGTFAEHIRRSGHRLLITLNALLDLGRLEADDVDVRPRPVELRPMVRELLAFFEPFAHEKNLDLRLDEPAPQATARIDRVLCARALANVLDNAIKFTEAGEVAVRVETTDEAVCFEVEDTGIGIDPEFLPRLFDDFTQQSVGYARTHEGAGLGLTITLRLARLMGGEVEADSTPGRGTRIRLRIPQAAPATEAGVRRDETSANRSS